jgi:hypothetical protein
MKKIFFLHYSRIGNQADEIKNTHVKKLEGTFVNLIAIIKNVKAGKGEQKTLNHVVANDNDDDDDDGYVKRHLMYGFVMSPL